MEQAAAENSINGDNSIELLIFVRCISFHLVKIAKSPTANKIAVSL